MWHRRQHGLLDGADFVVNDMGCDWLPLVALRQECGLLSGNRGYIRGEAWGELGFFWLLRGERGAGEWRLLSGRRIYCVIWVFLPDVREAWVARRA